MNNIQESIIKTISESEFVPSSEARVISFLWIYKQMPDVTPEKIREEMSTLEGTKLVGDNGLDSNIEIPAYYFSK